MTGSEIFWQSGTWWFFVGQLAVLGLIVYMYYAQGRREREAQERARERSNG